jgi:uncharacterized protein (TIGR02246 family)
MKKLLALLGALCFLGRPSHAQNHSQDEAAIQHTIDRFGASWAKADFADMGEYLTPDCHWINVVGMHWRNLKEVQFAHQAFATKMLKGVPAQRVESTLKFVTPDVAIVYLRTHIGAFYPPDGVNRGLNKQGDKDNIATFVVVKQANQWRITSAQNNDVISQAAASDPVRQLPK